MEDPIIHFYETFLAEYDAKLRKARGVWYTPQPVVDFIVRSVDEILKTEFDLPQGLADTSKVKIKTQVQGNIKAVEREVHRVQILDPATGTGTFLAEVVKHIHKKFEGQEGIWSQYVEEHLIPRLNGFELLMASYAMAHLKLDLLLTEKGYVPTGKARAQRLNVYLTNSLEQANKEVPNLFMSQWLTEEGIQADYIKRDTPVMCIIGNPPYSGESANKGDWIMNLMDDYKKEPGGKEKLKEQNSKFINDDYVKFLRYGQHFIEKNGSGVLAFINPHGFLDNPTFRGMRWNLLKTYDKIYTIDLHGNAKKREVAPDGSSDHNVFDIEQGVSINFFIKHKDSNKQKGLGKVFHFDLFGKRESKYNYLSNNSIKTTKYIKVDNNEPFHFFVPKDFEAKNEYDSGFFLLDLFAERSLGVLSKNDDIAIDFDRKELNNRIQDFKLMNEAEIRNQYKVKKDSRDWQLAKAMLDIVENDDINNFKNLTYRPFDSRWTYFSGRPKGFFAYSQNRIMRHLKSNQNLGLIVGRQGQAVGSMQWNLSFITNTISDQNIYRRGGGTVFPLYLYPEENTQQSLGGSEQSEGGKDGRVPNLNMEIVDKIAEGMGMHFVPEEHEAGATVEVNTFTPTDLLDYIYAVLHSPNYREKYKEFLKIDFPRVPYPRNSNVFYELAELGKQLREIHLLESKVVENYITKYPISGDNEVVKPRYETDSPPERRGGSREGETRGGKNTTPETQTGKNKTTGRVYINKEQYFEGVPELAWNFYIGGYQPLQKWLKDRKGRTLSFEDIQHYQKIVVRRLHLRFFMYGV
jgi:predicted helicase